MRYRYLSHIMLLALASMVMIWPLRLDAKDDYDIYDLSLDENLVTPQIKNSKQADKIQDFQYDMAVAFKRSNYEVEVMREGEVIVVTLPASLLFEPNDTVLTTLGESQLKPFLRMIKNPGFYKLLLVENGSVDYVVPYALGETDPIVDNNSVENRKRNRRLEIYLVPEKTMIQQAKKGVINISKHQ